MPPPGRCGKGMAQPQGFFPSSSSSQGWQCRSVPTSNLPYSATVSFLMHLPTCTREHREMGHEAGMPPAPPEPPCRAPHSHRQAGEGAIAEEQVSRGEGSDAKLLHELLLAAQHPPHCNVLVLQHVQGHLQAPGSDMDSPAPPGMEQSCSVPWVTFGTG